MNATISLKLPPVLLNKLRKRSRETGRTQSEIIRDALEASLDGNRSITAESSLHDLVSHLAGTGKGPKDLSANKKYLRDFGQ
jgi:metal-responsive CopG/Arc/MetJ family transcriptional regulator